MTKHKGLRALVLAVLLMFVPSGIACAHEVPDASQLGTISAVMTYDGAAVPGGSLTLYRVGDVVSDDGNYGFALTEAFAGSEVSLDDVESAETAEALADYAETAKPEGVTVTVDGEGHVTFTDLEIGLYLVVQGEPADGYEPINPFLVSLPMNDGEAYLYDVDASPKLELEKAPVPPETPPQTGSAVVPAAIVAAAALVLVGIIGVARFRRARRTGHDLTD